MRRTELLMAWIAGIQDNLERTMLISSSESTAHMYVSLDFDSGRSYSCDKQLTYGVYCIRDL